MDLIFIEKPILALVILLPALILHAAAFVMRSHKLVFVVELLNVALHSAAVAVIWLMGGGYEDVLVFVLLSAVVAFLRYRPQKKGVKNK